MDLTEKGIDDFGLRFGEAEGYLKAPELIAPSEGIGAELALGARGLAAKYGVPELAMEVKNLELPGYDPRGAFGMSLAYATSDRGGCHMRTYPIADEIVGGTLPPDTLEGKAEQVVWGNPADGIIGENFSSVKFSGIWCDFWAVTPEQIAQIFKHVWKREFTEDEVIQIGERIWNLGRLFNLREGVEPDDLPQKLYAEEGAHTDGASAGQAIGDRDVRGGAAGVLPAPRLGRERRAHRGQARRARRRRAPLDGAAPRRRRTDASRDDLEQEVHRLPHVRAGLLRLPRGRLPPLGRPPLRRGATPPPAPSRATPACRPAAPSARRPAPTTPS